MCLEEVGGGGVGGRSVFCLLLLLLQFAPRLVMETYRKWRDTLLEVNHRKHTVCFLSIPLVSLPTRPCPLYSHTLKCRPYDTALEAKKRL